MFMFPSIRKSLTLKRLVIRVLNALLKREDWARQRLAAHLNKTIRLTLKRLTLDLMIVEPGLIELASDSPLPDVTVTLQPEKLRFVPSLNAQTMPATVLEAIHISGEALLSQVIAELAKNLRWDVEDDLAKWLGDMPAASLIHFIKSLTLGIRTAGKRVVDNLTEYVSHERAWITPKSILKDWQRDIQQTVEATHTLDQRLIQIDRRLTRLAPIPQSNHPSC